MEVIGKKLTELPTPTFCVDLNVVEKNCDKMVTIAKSLNVQLRAQVKTHKTMYVCVKWWAKG